MPFLILFAKPILGQSIFSLKGKNITLTSLPAPFSNYGRDQLKTKNSKKFGNIYYIEALKTNSFKDKFLYKGDILSKEVHIEDVLLLNNDNKNKRTLIVSLSYKTDTLFIYYPLHLKTNIMFMGFYEEVDKEPEKLDIAYYDNDSIRSFSERMMLSPTFYLHNRKYLFENIKYENTTFFLQCKDLDSKSIRLEISPNSTYSTKEKNLAAYYKDIVLEKDLIAKCKQSIDSTLIQNFIKKFSNKEIYLKCLDNGFYQCGKIEITNIGTKSPHYAYTMSLTKDGKERKLYISEAILKNVVLADEYRAELRMQEEEEEREEKEYQSRIAREEAQEKNRLIKKYGKRNALLILDEKVVLGFTKQMCIESWGEPMEINRTITRYGTQEQWVYGIGTYLYFSGNTLTAIQD